MLTKCQVFPVLGYDMMNQPFSHRFMAIQPSAVLRDKNRGTEAPAASHTLLEGAALAGKGSKPWADQQLTAVIR